MAEQSTGNEDDWVKQMLAEAMLGRSPLPSADVVAADTEDSVAEPTPIVDEVVFDEAPAPDVPAPADPVIRYQVVLDEPEPTAPVSSREESIQELDTAPVGVEEGAGGVSTEEVSTEEPAAASTSRLFERPSFDATNDPGVGDMLASERARSTELKASEEPTRLRGAVEWVVVLGSAVIVALLLRAFLFQAFFIPSESMEATLRVDDRVLVNKLSYRLGDVERGEVVVFRRPDDQPGEFRDLIKRVIGLPGESIEGRDNTIFIDGQVLIEPYLTPGEVIGDFGPVVVPAGEYFMMGDNRDNSGDSRVFGTVDGERFIGRAFFLFWPFDRIGSL